MIAAALLWWLFFQHPNTGPALTVRIAELKAWLDSLGWWAPAISILLFVLQAVIAPLPSTPIIVANGILYGPLIGSIISWSGVFLGAVVSYAIARAFRNFWLLKNPNSSILIYVDRISDKGGFWIVLAARLTPLISLDFIGFAAGLSSIRLVTYLAATALGQTPSIIAYTILGHDSVSAGRMTIRIVVIILSGVFTFIIARWWFRQEKLI